ncbi:hypothetical protein ABW19_dt0209374 [Dactylella cylindrospora]|nr:hypothetical protein ABW19_dt0209374 [Dactylella cylindrospora]
MASSKQSKANFSTSSGFADRRAGGQKTVSDQKLKRKRPDDSYPIGGRNPKHANPRSKNDGSDKRRKFQDAREISIQTAEDAFRDGQLDVVSFVNSREFEIKSLLRSMNGSRNSQQKRAFQNLPRDLRRRTAAHNPSRVPKRVRKIAKKELIDDNTVLPKKRRDYRPHNRRLNVEQLRTLSTGTKSGQSKPPKPKPVSNSSPKALARPLIKSSRYRKRQRHKTWLPTHIWTAKRARMIVRWGFSLAETPTLKCYRPTYRAASREGCVAFDTSYYATILLEGRENDLKRCVLMFLPPKDSAVVGKQTVSGRKSRSTWIYEEGKWPTSAISPIHIFWCPDDEAETGEKGTKRRKVVLRVHPSASDAVWEIIKSAASSTNCKPLNLRYEIGSIKLVGPTAVETLRTLLYASPEFAACLKDSPIDTVLHRDAADPRLISAFANHKIGSATLDESGPPRHPLFDTNARNSSVKRQVSQKTLNSRASRLAEKGTGGVKLSGDVPIVLIKEALGERGDSDHLAGFGGIPYDCWSIILPWKWVRPFWLVLMRRVGVRLGGLKELEQLTLEGGYGYYPVDFVATTAGRNDALRRYEVNRERIARRSTMKTKESSKESSWSKSCAEYGYPWDEVFLRHLDSAEATPAKIYHLSPDLVGLFRRTPKPHIPPSVSYAVFTVHIRIFGRGTAEQNARIYNLPKRGSNLFSELVLQNLSGGKRSAPILEDSQIFGHRTTGHSVSGDTQMGGVSSDKKGHKGNDDGGSPIGFVVRGSFGYAEGISVAIGVVAWSQAWNGHGDFGDSRWCVIQNKDKGLRRLAQWRPI